MHGAMTLRSALLDQVALVRTARASWAPLVARARGHASAALSDGRLVSIIALAPTAHEHGGLDACAAHLDAGCARRKALADVKGGFTSAVPEHRGASDVDLLVNVELGFLLDHGSRRASQEHGKDEELLHC